MNVDRILTAFNEHRVRYLLIGGMNFLLRHEIAMKTSAKRAEEQKRERHWSRRERWRVLQETIAWADAQQEASRNSRATCLRLQTAKLSTSYRVRNPMV